MSLDKSGPVVSAAIVKAIIKVGGKPRLWCVNDDYYFAAYTASQAFNCALTEWGMEATDEDAPDIRDVREVSEGGLDIMQIEDEDDPNIVRTFREQLEIELAAGTEIPFAFAMRE